MSSPSDTDLVLLLGQMNGKLDMILEEQRLHGNRLTSLETVRNRLVGALACFGALLAYTGRDHMAQLVALIH